MDELMRAVKAMLTCMERDDYVKCVLGLGNAYDAQIAEWKKRRVESCVTGPFIWKSEDENGMHYSRIYYHNGQIVAEGCVTFHDKRQEIHEDEAGQNVCAALNAYYGYDKDGRDMVGELWLT